MAVGNYVSTEIKLLAVKEYQADTGSLNQVAAKFGVNRSTLQKWLLNYDLFGEESLQHRAKNHCYPEELKQQAVESYLSGQMSIETVCKKYQICSRTQLEKWISVYNGQKEFRPAGGKREGARSAMAGYEERKQAIRALYRAWKRLRFNCNPLWIYIPADLWVGAKVPCGWSEGIGQFVP